MTPESLERIRARALEELLAAPAPRPWWRDAALLAGVNALAAGATALVLGRHGLVHNEASPGVLVALSVLLVLLATLGPIAAVFPGTRSRAAGMLWLSLLAAGALLAGGSGHADGRPFLVQGLPCLQTEVLASLAPLAVALFVQTRFACRPRQTFAAGLAAAAGGLFALHLHCANGTLAHLALFHLAPWVAVAAAAVGIRARVRSKSFSP